MFNLHRNHRFVQLTKVTLLSGFLVFMSGCGKDSTSSVGYQSDESEPTAHATAVLLGEPADSESESFEYTARSNTEVVLTGKDSDSPFAPVLHFNWTQIDDSGHTVSLVKKSQNTVAFTAPTVTETTRLAFELTIIDGNKNQAKDIVYVNVQPGADANHFLTHPSVSRNELTVKAVLDENDSTAANVPSVVSFDVSATLHWTNRNSEDDSLEISRETVNLTFPANFSPTPGYDGIANTQNPKAKVNIPRVDGNLINSLFEETDKHRRIEPYLLDDAYVELTIEVTDTDGKTFELFVLNGAGTIIDFNSLDYCQSSCSPLPSGAVASNIDLTSSIHITDLLTALGLESYATADAYYTQIGAYDLLKDWLGYAGFNNGSTNKITHYDAHATYVNNYDLGFGRDMYSRKDSQGNIYSIVTNYPTLESAMLGSGEFAVVAMEYSDAPIGSDAHIANRKIVKFYAYIYDNRVGGFVLARSLNFDGRGEKHIPGSCTGCHQGDSAGKSFTDANNNDADLGATFIPWDIGAFLFSDAENDHFIEPTLNKSEFTTDKIEAYSREAQEDDIRILNDHALATYASDKPRFQASIELINGWYGRSSTTNTDPLPNNTFNEDYVQPGWAGEEYLYLGAYAPYCRICHTQVESTSRNFDNYVEFIDNSNLPNYVFEQGLMPLARLSMDRFWVNFYGEKSGAEILKEHLAGKGITDLPDFPGQPVVAYTVTPNSPTQPAYLGDLITIDASNSSFVENYSWAILSEPSSANSILLSSSGPVTSFIAGSLSTPSVPGGTYSIELTVTNNSGAISVKTIDIPIIDRRPDAECFDANVMGITDAGIISGIDVIDRLQASNAGDGNPTVIDTINGTFGTASITDGKTLQYELNDTFVRGSDTIYYQIEDFDGGESGRDSSGGCVNGGHGTGLNDDYASITIDLSGNFELTPQNLAAALDNTDDTETINITWDAPTDIAPDSYNIYINDSVTPINVSATPRSYSDTGLLPNTLYKYEVTTIVGTDESAKSDAASVTTEVLIPDTLTAVIPGDNTITDTVTLSWNKPTGNVDGYKLYRDNVATTLNVADLVDSSNPSVVDTGLTAGQVYTYEVTAFDSTQESNKVALNNGGKTTIATRAAKPTGLGLTLSGTPGYYISADWDDPAGSNIAESYKLYRATDSTWLSINTAASNYDGTTTMLAPFKLYSFYVAAINDDGVESEPSDIEDQITDPDPASSTKPTWDTVLVDATDDASQIELAWNAPNAYTIDSYTIYRFITADFSIDCDNDTPPYNVGLADGGPISTASTNSSDTGLTYGTSYTYMITASYDPGDGSSVESHCSSVQASTDALTPSSLTSNINTERTTTTVTVNWTAPAANVDAYAMHVSGQSNQATGASKPYAFTGLSAGTQYTFSLSATQDSTEGGSQTATSATQSFATKPNAMTDLSATASTSLTDTISLSWTGNGADSYDLEYSTNNSTWLNVPSYIVTTNTSASHTGLTSGQIYYYRVKAIKYGVSSDWDTDKEITKPSISSVTRTGVSDPTDELKTSWTRPSTSYRYDIRHSISSGMTSPTTVSSNYNGTSVDETGLNPATYYYFQIRAIIDGETSGWSATSNAFTKPIAPTITSITRNNVDQLTPNWSNPTGNETSYKVYYYDASNVLINSYSTGTTRNRSFSSLSNYTTYKFKVSATLGGLESDLSGFSSERTKASITNIEADCTGCHDGATAKGYVTSAISNADSWWPNCAINANGDCTAHVTAACDSTYNTSYNMCSTALSTTLRQMISDWYSDHGNNPAGNDKNYP